MSPYISSTLQLANASQQPGRSPPYLRNGHHARCVSAWKEAVVQGRCLGGYRDAEDEAVEREMGGGEEGACAACEDVGGNEEETGTGARGGGEIERGGREADVEFWEVVEAMCCW